MAPVRLEDAARAILRDPSLIPKAPPIGNRHFILQAWHHPSLDSWMSWTIYSPWTGMTDTALVRRTIWDHRADREKGSAKPAIHIRDAALDWKQVETWRAALADLKVPLVQGRTRALDGDTSGLRYGDEFLGMEFQWTEKGPAEWKDLVKFQDRVREACDVLFM